MAEGAQDVAGNPVKSDHIREVRLWRFLFFVDVVFEVRKMNS